MSSRETENKVNCGKLQNVVAFVVQRFSLDPDGKHAEFYAQTSNDRKIAMESGLNIAEKRMLSMLKSIRSIESVNAFAATTMQLLKMCCAFPRAEDVHRVK